MQWLEAREKLNSEREVCGVYDWNADIHIQRSHRDRNGWAGDFHTFFHIQHM